ncbi:MAG TPA: filamentous hemagglutinin N-terminal domain-containing protein [Fontimonas sp.]
MSKKQLTPQLTPIARALRAAATVLTGSTMLWPVAIPANPTGGQVVGGQAQIGNPVPGGTVINQQSNAAIINWQNFSIGDGEYVVFNQPSVSAATLNRVIGNLPSEILGNLTANGRVFVINPQGVMFGANSRVDVGALVTSTGNISNEDFLAGRLQFSGGSEASIVNRGQISAANGGFVVLSADKVTNSGTISAQGGDVLLAAGRQLSLQLDPEGLVSYSVDAAAASAAAGVENFGDIIANGGAVVMAANVARELIGTAINNSGRVAANAIEQRGGEIFLVAEGGNIEQRGTLDASSAQGDGGTISIRSDRNIAMSSSSVTDASGARGGEATAIAGGNLSYAAGAALDVSGSAGDGGFAELSGNTVQILGSANLGRGGELLIDPVDIVVDDAADVQPGDTSFQSYESLLGTIFSGGGVSLAAENSVRFRDYNSNFFSTSGYGGGLSVIVGATCSVDCVPLSGAPTGIFFDGADDQFSFDDDIVLDASLTANGVIQSVAGLQSFNGSVNATAPGQITLASVAAGGTAGSIMIDSGGSVVTGTLSAVDDIDIVAGGSITTDDIFSVDDLRLTATGGDIETDISMDGIPLNTATIEANNGNVRVKGDVSAYGAFKVTAGGTVALSTAAINDSNEDGTIDAQSIDVSGAGDISTGAMAAVNSIKFTSSGGRLDLASASISGMSGANTITLSAAQGMSLGDINADYGGTIATISSASGDIEVNDITLGVGGSGESRIKITASDGDVAALDDGGVSISADAIDVTANSIDLYYASLSIGSGIAEQGHDIPFVTLDPSPSTGTPVVQPTTPIPGITPAGSGDVAVSKPNASFVAGGSVDIGGLNVDGGYLFIRADSANVGTINTPLNLYNFRPSADTSTLNVGLATGGALSQQVLTYLLGGTGYSGEINFQTLQIIDCDTGCQELRSSAKDLTDANYVLYTTGNIRNAQGTIISNTGGYASAADGLPGTQTIVLKRAAATPPPTPTPTPEPTLEPTPEPTPTPTPVVTPTPTPVVTPTPTPVVTPTPTPVVTPTPTPVITPTPTPVITPTPTPVVTPTPTPTPPLGSAGEIFIALAEASKTDDPFLAPTPVPREGQGDIERRDTSYQIGEFSCDATGVQ